MKRIFLFLIVTVMLGMSFPVVNAGGLELYYDKEYHTYKGSIFSLYVNDKKINPPLEPIIFNNRAVVPLREIFEELGQTVHYENETKKITVTGNGQKVELQINNPIAYINGVEKKIPDGVVPKLIMKVGGETKTMVPVRFVSESLGLLVNFDEDEGAIRINSPKATQKIIIGKPSIKKKSDTVTQITLSLSSPMENTLKPAVTNAGVLYFDITAAEYEGASRTEVNHGAVKMVRLGLHDEYTRVAVDMENHLKYDVKLSGDKKIITITVTAKEKTEVEKPEEDEPVKEDEKPEAEPPKEEEKNEGNAVDKEEENIEIPETVTVTTDVKSMMNYTPCGGVKYVVIDAGHGGKDPGAKGTMEEKTYYEKDINLSVATMVKEKLEANGIPVIMTRAGDTYPTLNERSDLANKKDAAMFVSIHVNSASNAPKANGIEVYYAKGNNNDYYGTTSKAVATDVLKKMLDKTGAMSRGVKVESHLVTRTSLMPAVLVELGFISNADEIKKLTDKDYQQKLADGIVEGILGQYGAIAVPDRRTLAEKKVAEEIGEEKAKEYVANIWK